MSKGKMLLRMAVTAVLVVMATGMIVVHVRTQIPDENFEAEFWVPPNYTEKVVVHRSTLGRGQEEFKALVRGNPNSPVTLLYKPEASGHMKVVYLLKKAVEGKEYYRYSTEIKCPNSYIQWNVDPQANRGIMVFSPVEKDAGSINLFVFGCIVLALWIGGTPVKQLIDRFRQRSRAVDV